MPRRSAPKLARAQSEHRVAPARRNVEQRPQHERPLMGERMGQDQGPRTRSREIGVPPAPVPDQSAVIDDIDVEAARAPGSAAASARAAFDLFQHSEQRVRRQTRVEHCHGVEVRRLASVADRRRLIKWRHRKNGNIEPFNFA